MDAAIFDLDGTVWDSMGIWNNLPETLAHEYRLTVPENILEILTPLGLRASAEYFKKLGLDMTVDEIYQKMLNYAIEKYRSEIDLNPGVLQYIKNLKDKGVKMYAFTASPRELFDSCYKRHCLSDFFEFAITTDELGISKSDPGAYKKLCKMIKVSPDKITVFDDSVHALRSAKTAGLFTVGVYDKSADHTWSEIKSFADKYITSFTELI